MDELKGALSGVLSLLPQEAIKSVCDSVLDIAEEAIDSSETKIDDILLGNAIRVLRFVGNIEDGEE
jgi:hypothetical protein